MQLTMLGRLLHWLRVPGFVQPFEYRGESSGQMVSVRISPRYTILSIDGKEFFFRRETGAFDGTGAMSVDDAPALNYCRADRIRRWGVGHPKPSGAPQRPSSQKEASWLSSRR